MKSNRLGFDGHGPGRMPRLEARWTHGGEVLPTLGAEFRMRPAPGTPQQELDRWAMGNGIGIVWDDALFAESVELACDARFGEAGRWWCWAGRDARTRRRSGRRQPCSELMELVAGEGVMVDSERKYEPLVFVSIETTFAEVACGVPERVVRALLAASLASPERTWVEACAYSLSISTDPQVRTAAVLAIGHLARRFGDVTRPAITEVFRRRDGDRHVDGALRDLAEDLAAHGIELEL